MGYLDPKEVENRQHAVIPLNGGLYTNISPFTAPPGTLRDALNYEVWGPGYSSVEGLMQFTGSTNHSIVNAFVVIWDGSGVVLPYPGQIVTWDEGASTGRAVYAYKVGDVNYLWLDDIDGAVPDDTSFLNWDAGVDPGIPSSAGLVNLNSVLAADKSVGPLFDVTLLNSSTKYIDQAATYLSYIRLANLWHTQHTGWPTQGYFKPSPPGTGPVGGLDFQDSVYVVRDWPKIRFILGTTGANSDVTGPYAPSFTLCNINGTHWKVAHCEMLAGEFYNGTAQGWLYLEPPETDQEQGMDFGVNATYLTTDATDVDSHSPGNTIQFGDEANTFTGYTAQVAEVQRSGKGWLWKSNTEGWSKVETGYWGKYINGEQAPIAEVGPLFLNELEESTAPTRDTGWVANTGTCIAVNNASATVQDNWTNPENAVNNTGYTSSFDENFEGASPLTTMVTTGFANITTPPTGAQITGVAAGTDGEAVFTTSTAHGLVEGDSIAMWGEAGYDYPEQYEVAYLSATTFAIRGGEYDELVRYAGSTATGNIIGELYDVLFDPKQACLYVNGTNVLLEDTTSSNVILPKWEITVREVISDELVIRTANGGLFAEQVITEPGTYTLYGNKAFAPNLPGVTCTGAAVIERIQYSYGTTRANNARSVNGIPQTLRIAIPSDTLPANAEYQVTGVEVRIHASAYSSVNDVELKVWFDSGTNDGSGLVLSRNENTVDAYTPMGGEFGAQFNVPYPDLQNISSGNASIHVDLGRYSDTGDTTSVTAIEYKIYYVVKREQIWFTQEGQTSIVAEDFGSATVVALDTHTGSWDQGTATGYLTLADVTNPIALTNVEFVRAQTEQQGTAFFGNAAGDKLFNLTEGIRRNYFPSSEEIEAVDGRWSGVSASFYANDESEMGFLVNGADSCQFITNNDRVGRIFLPVEDGKDKPRHCAYFNGHLALGLNTGHLLLSATDVPNDFDTAGTATTWSFRDPIRGLAPLSGNALGVFCQDTIHGLVGNSPVAEDPNVYRKQLLSSTVGILEHTLVSVGALPFYTDFHGVSNLQTTDRFGDFESARLTEMVEQLTRSRLQGESDLYANWGVSGAIKCRNKGQYRLFFKDGYVLSLYLGGADQPPQAMLTHYDTTNFSRNYVPSWLSSVVLSNGRERMLLSDKFGNLFMIDEGNAIYDSLGRVDMQAWIETNPTNSQYLQGSVKTFAWTVMGQAFHTIDATASYGEDYLSATQAESLDNYYGTASAPAVLKPPMLDSDPTVARGNLNLTPVYTDMYLDTFTDGLSLRLETTLEGYPSHTYQALLHRHSLKSRGRQGLQGRR